METNHRIKLTMPEEEYVHRFPADWRADEEMLTRLTHAIAIVTDQRPEQFDPGVSNVVDSDALDRLFTPEAMSEDAQLTIRTSGPEVQIRADGSLFVVE